MNCSSSACASNCITCNSSTASGMRSTALVSAEPLSTAEELLMREYLATVSQRKTVTAADMPVNFVCELERGLS